MHACIPHMRAYMYANMHSIHFIIQHQCDTNIDDDIMSASDAIDRSHRLLSGV